MSNPITGQIVHRGSHPSGEANILGPMPYIRCCTMGNAHGKNCMAPTRHTTNTTMVQEPWAFRNLTVLRLPLSAYSMMSVNSDDEAIAPYTATTLPKARIRAAWALGRSAPESYTNAWSIAGQGSGIRNSEHIHTVPGYNCSITRTWDDGKIGESLALTVVTQCIHFPTGASRIKLYRNESK